MQKQVNHINSVVQADSVYEFLVGRGNLKRAVLGENLAMENPLARFAFVFERIIL